MKYLFIISILLINFSLFSQNEEHNVGDEFIWDTITFEEPYEYIFIDTSNHNIWQIGEPNKEFFNNAYSINNAIITDTINYYSVNNNSYFDLYIGDFNIDWYPEDIFIQFKHKFNTDTLKDGGFITVSYDNGASWMNIIEDTAYFQNTSNTPENINHNLYSINDTLHNGEYGFSGNSNDWITTYFGWHVLLCKSNMELIRDTMIVRFHFISDSVETNKEGWMIDDIKLYSVDIGSNINKSKPLDFKIYPNPMNEIAIIELSNYNEIELNIFDIKGQLVKHTNYFNNETISINKRDFKAGTYLLKIKTKDNLIVTKKLIIR